MDIIICPECEEVLKKEPLKDKEAAFCPVCGNKLYSNIHNIEYKLFVFSLSSLLFFVIYNIYPMIKMDIIGKSSQMNLVETIFLLFDKGYVFIGLFTFFTVVLFPFLLNLSYLMFALMLIFKRKSIFLLRIITFLKSWVMVDIFFVSILVALVKVVKYGYIELLTGFWAILIYFILQVIMSVSLKIEYLWEVDV